MKIIGIEPVIPGPHYLSEFHIPRLGLLQLLTNLQKQGHQVKAYLEEVKPIGLDQIEEADLYCISTITATAPLAYQYAGHLKRKFGKPTVIGGSHVTFLMDEALDFCDYVVRYEGEYALPQLVEALEGKRSLEEIPNLSYKKSGEKIHNPVSSQLPDLNTFPSPNFNLVYGWKPRYVTPIETTRSCPYRCTFCSVWKMFGKVRFKDIEKVVEEIQRLHPRHVFFSDDNFAINPERTKKLLELIARKLDEIPIWTAQVRIDVSQDKELLRLMKRTNCWRLFIGLESVNPETLKEYNKRQTLEEIKEGLEKLRRHGIDVHGMFVIGGDADTLDTVKETLKFSKKVKLTSIQFAVRTPLPGTDDFQRFEKENRLLSKDWQEYDSLHCVFKPAKMTPTELQKSAFWGGEKFFSWKERFNSSFKGLVSGIKEWFSLSKPVFYKNLLPAGIKFYGHRAIKRIKKQVFSRDFVRKLKEKDERS